MKKNIFKKILDRLFYEIRYRGYLNFISDEKMLKILFRYNLKKSLNLENPQTYNEKLQWLKLYNRNLNYTNLVDKVEVKKYVSDIIGDNYVIPTLGVWNSFDDIEFEKLPNEFVLKCTHDSGGIVICKDKKKFNKEKARKKLNKSLNSSFFWLSREWPYKNIKPRIIAEKFISSKVDEDLKDYKFFCFSGKVKALYVASDRGNIKEETKFDFFDENFNRLPFTNGYPNSLIDIEKPSRFELMKSLAEKLGVGFPHVRIDFYEVDGQILFGEMTFYHMSGLAPFNPEEWDQKFGAWLELPEMKKKKERDDKWNRE